MAPIGVDEWVAQGERRAQQPGLRGTLARLGSRLGWWPRLLLVGLAAFVYGQFVVGGNGHKHGRRIRWNGSIFKLSPARVDRSHEGGPAFRQVMEGDSGSDRSTSGESDDAHAVGGNSPFRRVLPNVGYCRQPIGDGKGNRLP